jgi:hypothetical protein
MHQDSLAPGWPLRTESQPSRKLLQPNGFEWGWRRVACQGFIERASRKMISSRWRQLAWSWRGREQAQKGHEHLRPSALGQFSGAASAHTISRFPGMLGLIVVIVGLGGRSFAKHYA